MARTEHDLARWPTYASFSLALALFAVGDWLTRYNTRRASV